MTHLAHSQAFGFTETAPQAKARIAVPAKAKKARVLSQEDTQIVTALGTLKRELDYLHNCYDQATDPLLVDSITYALKAANMKYMYYLHLCKEKGIVCRTDGRG